MSLAYEGFYARFDSPNKAVGSLLMGPDNIVGDEYRIEFRTEDGRVVAWVKNKFDAEVGFFDVDGSRKLQLAHARGLEIHVLLSFVAYSDEPDPGLYWGEMAVICFNALNGDAMKPFVERVARKLADGVRPNIDLGTQAASRILEDPEWFPTETVPLPEKKTGMAVLKDHQSMSEKMIEQGRARNKGCYAVSIAFIIAIVALIAYGVARLMGAL